MIDLFVFCDLGRTDVSVRGTMDEHDAEALVRVVENFPVESRIRIDLSELLGAAHRGVQVLERALAGWSSRIIELVVPVPERPEATAAA